MSSDIAARKEIKGDMPCQESAVGCLFCVTGKERVVAEQIRTCHPEVRAIAARQEKHQTCQGQKSKTEVILLPGYVFFEADPKLDASVLLEIENVIRVLSVDAGVWKLRDEDERFARWLFQYDGLLRFSKAYKDGDRIRILHGPLKDLEGRITRVDKRGRSGQVLLNFNDRNMMVWLGFDLVDNESLLKINEMTGKPDHQNKRMLDECIENRQMDG